MKRRHKVALALIMALGVVSCSKKVAAPKPYGALPTEKQMKWQDLNYYMFIHFGPNTFTDVEWGDGKEDPKVFNPTNLDTDQWASVAKDAGMTGIIITAKHHDGFCLWPSEYSTHTVRESLWRDGKGDILEELSESCKKYGLNFGVYLSPWDQNHPAYNTPEYNQVFANTLKEVLTNYGPVYEQWFDGATDGTSRQVYDWKMFHDVVYKHQPEAVIFSDVGPDIRWTGNERGYGGETNWSTLNIEGFTPGIGAPSTDVLNTGERNGQAWIPAEVNVSIRPGWFYSPTTDDKVKSVDHLMDIYYASHGRSSNLLLNIPPDRRGLIHPNDSARLMEFRAARQEAFKTQLVDETIAKSTASNVRGNSDVYAANNLTDGNKDSYWATDDGVTTATLEIDLGKSTTFNRVLLQEYIPLGQRIAAFTVAAWDSATNSWVKLADATTIGFRRILRVPSTTTDKLQITINESLAEPLLSNFELYNAPEVGQYDGSKTTKVVLASDEAIILNLGKEQVVNELTFTPYPSEAETTIQRYNLYVSKDGESWYKVVDNEVFNNIKNNPIAQDITLINPANATFVKLEPTQLTNNNSASYVYSSLEVK